MFVDNYIYNKLQDTNKNISMLSCVSQLLWYYDDKDISTIVMVAIIIIIINIFSSLKNQSYWITQDSIENYSHKFHVKEIKIKNSFESEESFICSGVRK